MRKPRYSWRSLRERSLTYVGHYGLSWVNLEHIGLHLILLPVSMILLTFAAGSAFAVIVPRIGEAYCYELARICTRKYRWLDRSLLSGVLGYGEFLVTMIFL
jgi:hypothetical protein